MVDPTGHGATGREQADTRYGRLPRGDMINHRRQHVDDRDADIGLDTRHEGMRGIAGNRDGIGTVRFQSLTGGEHRDARVFPVADQIGGAIGNLRILLHHHLEVILIALGACQPHHLAHEVHRRGGPDAAQHTQLELPPFLLAVMSQRVLGVDSIGIQQRHRNQGLQRGHHHRDLAQARHDDLRTLTNEIIAGFHQLLQTFTAMMAALDAGRAIDGLHQRLTLHARLRVEHLELRAGLGTFRPGHGLGYGPGQTTREDARGAHVA